MQCQVTANDQWVSFIPANDLATMHDINLTANQMNWLRSTNARNVDRFRYRTNRFRCWCERNVVLVHKLLGHKSDISTRVDNGQDIYPVGHHRIRLKLHGIVSRDTRSSKAQFTYP